MKNCSLCHLRNWGFLKPSNLGICPLTRPDLALPWKRCIRSKRYRTNLRFFRPQNCTVWSSEMWNRIDEMWFGDCMYSPISSWCKTHGLMMLQYLDSRYFVEYTFQLCFHPPNLHSDFLLTIWSGFAARCQHPKRGRVFQARSSNLTKKQSSIHWQLLFSQVQLSRLIGQTFLSHADISLRGNNISFLNITTCWTVTVKQLNWPAATNQLLRWVQSAQLSSMSRY